MNNKLLRPLLAALAVGAVAWILVVVVAALPTPVTRSVDPTITGITAASPLPDSDYFADWAFGEGYELRDVSDEINWTWGGEGEMVPVEEFVE